MQSDILHREQISSSCWSLSPLSSLSGIAPWLDAQQIGRADTQKTRSIPKKLRIHTPTIVVASNDFNSVIFLPFSENSGLSSSLADMISFFKASSPFIISSTAPDGAFHRVCRFHGEVIQEIFTHEVFSLLLRKRLIGLPLVHKILGWRHTGFNVLSKVRTQTTSEAERVGKYMIQPLLSLKRLFFDETTGKVRYQYSRHGL